MILFIIILSIILSFNILDCFTTQKAMAGGGTESNIFMKKITKHTKIMYFIKTTMSVFVSYFIALCPKKSIIFFITYFIILYSVVIVNNIIVIKKNKN